MATQWPPITSDLPPLPLPEGITSSYIHTPSLTYHILSSGAPTPTNPTKKPLILLLHGFPELAYSWRKIMVPLSQLARSPTSDDSLSGMSVDEAREAWKAKGEKDGYHVVAYDQRGYGRTTGSDTRSYHDVDLNTFRMTEVVKDAVRLVHALGYEGCECIVGHDFGAVGASLAGLIRPDVFKRVVLMSHPFSGIPRFPNGTDEWGVAAEKSNTDIAECLQDLAKLPEPRKHYKWYYSTPSANEEMTHPKQGLREFLRGYFFLKSGNNSGNYPEKLKAWKAEEFAKMPGYYVMPLHKTMSQTVEDDTNADSININAVEHSKQWLSDDELHVYVDEFGRTGFQGGLNYYRVGTSEELQSDLEVFRGKKIEQPSLFISGDKDWGMYQTPGAMQAMVHACPGSLGFLEVANAGHWVMQEDPGAVVGFISKFLRGDDQNYGQA